VPRKALDKDARNTSALFLLGRALLVLRRPQESEPYLKTAIELSPQSFQSYNLLGQAYLTLARFDDAEKTYTSAVDLASPAERKQLAGAFGFEGVGDGYLKAKRKPDADVPSPRWIWIPTTGSCKVRCPRSSDQPNAGSKCGAAGA
jgi:tetratricopeptide (TPR) repeat protein